MKQDKIMQIAETLSVRRNAIEKTLLTLREKINFLMEDLKKAKEQLENHGMNADLAVVDDLSEKCLSVQRYKESLEEQNRIIARTLSCLSEW